MFVNNVLGGGKANYVDEYIEYGFLEFIEK